MKFHPSMDPLKSLTHEQFNMLEQHSFLNVLNVISVQLRTLADSVRMRDKLDALAEAVDGAALCLCRDDRSAFRPESIAAFQKQVMDAIGEVAAMETSAPIQSLLAEARGVLVEVFGVMDVRIHELQLRMRDRWARKRYTPDELRSDFEQFFHSIEVNSRGRFRITYNPATQGENTYLIFFKATSDRGDGIDLHLLYKDVMRDLIANARKYTAPGGYIHAGIHDGDRGIRFVLEDNGRGIPPKELPYVFNYGYRASNVQDLRTMGGGFGLTKALYVTQQLGGDLWIESELGKGARITIEIPHKPS